MPQIDVSFTTWKLLTAHLADEHDTYDAVIGRLLTSDNPSQRDDGDKTSKPIDQNSEGAYFKSAFLPNGTELRATYKGKSYWADVKGREWIDRATGERRNSPSQAAFEITGSGVNGWLFWLVKRPEDRDWQSLNALRYEASAR